MKKYEQFGIYDFDDFAEELNEQELLFVNGGSCGGTITPTNPTPTSTATTPTYGECGGKIAYIPPTGPSVPQPGTITSTCGGNIVVLDNKKDAFFLEQKTLSSYYDKSFGDSACATTSLLNELSEIYTKEKNKMLTKEEMTLALARAVNSGKIIEYQDGSKDFGDIRSDDAHVNSWEIAANDMAESLGLSGKFNFIEGASTGDVVIYAVDNKKKDSNGNKITGSDGEADHFVNDIGNGKYYDPYTGTIGNVSELTLAKDAYGGKRCLKYTK